MKVITQDRTFAIKNCAICNHSNLDLLWDLPKFPFTEKYGLYDPLKCPSVDQHLLMCMNCGHVQLGNQVDPKELYTSTEYSFRTSQSKSAQMGTCFFFDFFRKVTSKADFHSCLDIGGNDLFLAKMLAGYTQNRCVIDPVCNSQDGQIVDNIKILGRFIETVELSKEMPPPDLVVCRHVLEHIARPRELFLQLFEQCAPHALYIFEIPCFENLVEANRFDAIFHQHYHYFDVNSFKRLIVEAGGEYITHAYNRQGSCGGALLIAFRKSAKIHPKELINVLDRRCKIKSIITDYCNYMQICSRQLKRFNGKIYGYGASLMLATLAYHLSTDLSELIYILDDDPGKDNMGYQNLPVLVKNSAQHQFEPQSNYIITSLENTRAIFKKISETSPRKILIPCIS